MTYGWDKAMARTKISVDIETAVLINCGRRCALCVGLNNDHDVKNGQIAHIDRDSSNNAYENLAFLCIDHHDEYDTVRRQSKSLKPQELLHYKRVVCEQYGPSYSLLRRIWNEHGAAIIGLTNQTEHLAVEVDVQEYNAYVGFMNSLIMLVHENFSSELKVIINDWCNSVVNVIRIVSDERYIESGWRRKFDNGRYSQMELINKKGEVKIAIKEVRKNCERVKVFISS